MSTLRYALRTLFKTPFVTTVAVLSLALGIGANVAIFSMLNQVLLKPLPVHAPGELVNLSAPGPKPGSTSCNDAGDCEHVFSYPMFRDLEREQTPFTGIAAHRLFGANLSTGEQTVNAAGMLVSGSYFPTLGLQPAIGRLIGPTDDQTPGEPAVVVLSNNYWRTAFGASSQVLGQTLVVNGETMTIVGVAPEGFFGTTFGSHPKVYVPISMRGRLEPFSAFDNRQSYWAYLFARLAPGVSLEAAETSINQPYHSIVNNVEAPLQTGMSEQTMAQFKGKTIEVTPGQRGQSGVHEDAWAPLLILMGATGIVLLIACANIANLLLARSATRAGEMAVRLSIGAGRGHLIRQLLTESCLLAVLGGGAGLLVARVTLVFIMTLLPSDASETITFALDGTAMFYAAALALGTGVLFGLFPALHSTRPDLASTLKGTAGQPSGAKSAAWFRKALITAQITLSMALLALAALFVKSLAEVARADLGIEVDRIVTFRIAPRMNGYTAERSQQFFRQLEEAFTAQPGVTGVSVSLVPLLSGSNWNSNLTVQGFEAGPDTDTLASFTEVSPGYFRTLGIPLMAGREFTPADNEDAPRVAIVNEAFTRKFNLGREAVGKRMRQGRGDGELNIEIVGVSQDAKYSEVKNVVPAMFVMPYRQDRNFGAASVYVRVGLDPETFLSTVPPLVARLDPNLPVVDLRTMPQQVLENTFLDRMISTLAGAFAVLATLLAAVGLYGVMAFTVSQRTREFGLRMALGADPARVRRLVLVQVGRLIAVGAVLGIALAIAGGMAAQSLLYQVTGYDPAALFSAVGVLAVIALLAGLVPAVRASRVDPIRALRYE